MEPRHFKDLLMFMSLEGRFQRALKTFSAAQGKDPDSYTPEQIIELRAIAAAEEFCPPLPCGHKACRVAVVNLLTSAFVADMAMTLPTALFIHKLMQGKHQGDAAAEVLHELRELSKPAGDKDVYHAPKADFALLN